MEKYIGEKKIVNIVDNMVEFEDGSKGYYNDKQLWYLVTETPVDLTKLRDLMLDNVIPEIMGILENHNVRRWDLQAITQSVIWTYNEMFMTAIWKAFGTYREWIHPEYFTENIRPTDIRKY